uniref:Retrotransposon protein, putative, unclassified n=1 Tax=Oryza sativa subsp. japonica TaxID=39947 RepID=Q2QSY1_ORYSJ|nr:retrotransposon protein, putative, unclassified [Oryza sativa Japonica Group]
MVGCEHMVLKVVLMAIKDRLISGEKSVGVAGESMPLVIFIEGVIMIQEWCTMWYTSGQSKTIRIAVPTVMGGLSNVFRD